MTERPTNESPLVAAATALVSGLERWEVLVADAKGLQVSTDAALHRAKELLESCAASERDLAMQLHAFVTAMQAVQVRQQACMRETLDAAQRVQARIAVRTVLLERFAALGARAGEMSEPLGAVMDGIARSAPSAELLGPLDDVVSKVTSLVADAEGVADDARREEWLDIADDATSLKRQVESVRDEVVQAQRALSKDAPS